MNEKLKSWMKKKKIKIENRKREKLQMDGKKNNENCENQATRL